MSVNTILEDGLNIILSFVAQNDLRTVYIEKNNQIITQNTRVDTIYWADIVQFTLQHTTQNGKSLNLGVYCSANCFLGEIECLTDDNAQFDVIALEDTRLVAIPKEKFLALVEQNPSVSLWMAKNLASYYIKTMQISMDRSLYPLKYSIAKDIKQRFLNDAYTTHHDFIHKEAQRFHCTERAYNRIVKELLAENLIKKSGKNLVPASLEDLSDFLDSYES